MLSYEQNCEGCVVGMSTVNRGLVGRAGGGGFTLSLKK